MPPRPDAIRTARKFYRWVESELLESAILRLQNSSYAELRRISCDIDDGVLRLCGAVPRYHLKQLAFCVVADIKGLRRVENDIVVQREDHVRPSLAG